MDDIFEGYLVVDEVASFLGNDALISDTNQPRLVPPTRQQEYPLPAVPRALRPSINDQDQSRLTPTGGDITAQATLRQRRGHTKSRLGCIVCKKRKIKCQETWPSCANCDKRGFVCRYPDVFNYAQRDRIVSTVPNPRQLTTLSGIPNVYSSEDMQLFHHYLVSAYPTIPHDYEDIWTKLVPTLSHQYPYLLEGILALAGSHLSLQVDNPKTTSAFQHRQKAIVGLEEAFTRWPPSAGEGHIMLATSYLLTFQASYMEDGFLEHILSLRGCSLLSQLITNEELAGPFAVQVGLESIKMDMAFCEFARLDQELACEALLSLKGLSHLLAGPDAHPIEQALVTQFVETLRHLLYRKVIAESEEEEEEYAKTEAAPSSHNPTPSSLSQDSLSFTFINPLFPSGLDVTFQDIDWTTITSPTASKPDALRSYKAFMAVLTILSTWPHDALIHLFDSTNQLGNIVMAHFTAIRFVVAPLSAPKNAMKTPTGAVVNWMAKIIAAVDEDDDTGVWAQYVAWPRKILKCMQACVERKKGFTMGDVRDMLLYDPEAFKEGRAREYA